MGANYDPSNLIVSSVNSDWYMKRVHWNQSRDSDRTTNKEIYIRNDSVDYTNLDDIDHKMFTPPSKDASLRSSQRRNRQSRNQNTETNNLKLNEEDSSSSLEPLSSKLTDQKMKIYQTENMEELDLDQIRKTNSKFKHNMKNEEQDLKNRDQPKQPNFIVYSQNKNYHIHQVSGDKMTPSENQTTANEEQETPQIEFIPFDEEESKSITEFNWVFDTRAGSKSSNQHFYTFSNDTSSKHPEESNKTSENVEHIEWNDNELNPVYFTQSQSQRANFEYNIQDSCTSHYSTEGNVSKQTSEKLQYLKETYLAHSQYLSGITEKSDEESVYTNNLYHNSGYNREHVNSTLIRQEAFLSSNSSAKSSRINSRLLRYFEDSLQKEIPVSLSPSVKPNSKNNDFHTNSNTQIFAPETPANPYDTQDNVTLSTPNSKSKRFKEKRLQKSHEDLSNYSMTKSHNYEDLSNPTSSKKNYKYFFSRQADSEDSNILAPKMTYDQLEAKEDSCNSSMTRKEREIDKFIESAKEDHVLSTLGENEQNLNISSISPVENSTPEKKQCVSEDEKDDNQQERKISRQPTFSNFTPQPRYDEEYSEETKTNRMQSYKSIMNDNRCFTPLLSTSGNKQKLEQLSQINCKSITQMKQESILKSSEGTYPPFFISSDTKILNISSDGSRKYRSPTFEAISEEENNSRWIVDSPMYRRLSMDIDWPEKNVIQRATKRPPSIHAALSPDISLHDKDFISQNPKIIIAHYESIINSLNKEYQAVYENNKELQKKASKCKKEVSDANKLLLKLQEGKAVNY